MQLLDFLTQIQTIKRQNLAPEAALQQVSSWLAAFAADNNLGEFLSTTSVGQYPRRLLSPVNADFQLVLVLWGPRSASPIHDHDQALGAVTALMGRLTETKYTLEAVQGQRVRLQVAKTMPMETGVVSPILPDKSNQLHKMANESPSWGASLHLYMEPLRTFQIYEPRPDGWFTPVSNTLWFEPASPDLVGCQVA